MSEVEWDAECETEEVPTKCVICGKDPAEGFAMIGEDRLCHGDDEDFTCYMGGLTPSASSETLDIHLPEE